MEIYTENIYQDENIPRLSEDSLAQLLLFGDLKYVIDNGHILNA